MGNKKGSIGICYDRYKAGICVIFKNSEYCGFSLSEIDMFFETLTYDTNMTYNFTNNIQLNRDFENGYFDKYFNQKVFKRIEKHSLVNL